MLTITYGVGNSISKPEDFFRTVGQILNDTSIQTVLNFDAAQVDARVNGVVVDPTCPVSSNMRIDLIKKAGKKSDGTPLMNSDQQLRPLPVNSETLRLIGAAGAAALEPVYAEFSKAENAIRTESGKDQRELLKTCNAFTKYVDSIIEAVVSRKYLDADMNIPVEVREQLDAVAAAAEEKILPLRQAVAKQEAAVSAWIRAVEADLKMCLTLGEQRSVVAKALKADPLTAWTFDALIK